jgi:cytochrome P450
MTNSITDLTEDFDYTDPETVAHFHEVLAQMRAQSGAIHTSTFGGHWVLTRYNDVVRVARDTAGFTSTKGVTVPITRGPIPACPIELDPPEHTPYRQFLIQRFRKGQVAQLEPTIRQITRDCLDAVRGSGACDLMLAFADQVPALVIAKLLGLPEEDWLDFREWSYQMQTMAYENDAAGTAQVYEKIGGHLAASIEARRDGPDDGGLLFQLANEVVNGERIPTDIALGMAFLMLVAGHETTAKASGTQLLFLDSHPDLRQRLIDDPALIPGFVNEALRFDGPVTGMSRVATCPHKIDGQEISEGDAVLMMFTAANRDERVYTDPDTFDLARAERSHLGFGFGVHRCLGEHLAILELEIMLEEVLRVIPDYRVENPLDIEISPGTTRGPRSLSVTFTPSKA